MIFKLMKRLIFTVVWGLCVGISTAFASDHLNPIGAEDHAEMAAFDCPVGHDENAHCTPVFACIGSEGDFFQGRARGRGDIGLVRGRTGSGSHCSGFWQRDEVLGTGQSKLNCSDGMRAEVRWDPRKKETGYFVGTGQDSLDRPVLFWVGHFYLNRIQRENQTLAQFCMSFFDEEQPAETSLVSGVSQPED